jgi:TonB-linked SusC/RagA family outer membrane protein
MELTTKRHCVVKALRTLCLAILALTVSFSVSAQIVVTGTITEESGYSLPGVSVVVKGTTTGVLSDADGAYSITVPDANSTLAFSFIGYISKEVVVGNQRIIDIVLNEDIQQLEEVVVVGYGTQAKRDITGSVSVVSAEALAESSSVTFAEALQGKSAGVYVSTTGAPGAASTIRVRGVGSVNGSDPLIIIDGVSGGTISSVNANDIETFQVLKDASATAIYGAQGANGVIIVTTKQGTKTGQPRVSYNGYIGISTMSNDGFDLLNAGELMDFIGDGMRNLHNYRGQTPAKDTQFGQLSGYTVNADGSWTGGSLTMPFTSVPAGYSVQDVLDRFGDGTGDENTALNLLRDNYVDNGVNSYALSAYYYNILVRGMSRTDAFEGTNWFDLIIQDGFITDHQLSVVGGGDKGQYSMSISYTGQEGTVKNSYYDRYSIRLNTSFMPRKSINIGVNSNLSYTETQGDRGNNAEGGAFAYTYRVKPWVAPYNVSGQFAGTWNEGGHSNTGLAVVENAKGDWDRNVNSQNSIFLEIKPIPELTLRTQAAVVLSGSWGRSFNERTIEWNKEGSTRNSLSESASWSSNLQWTNTATYTKRFGIHNLTAVVGTEALDQDYGRNISASRYDYTFPDNPNTWIIGNGATADLSNGGGQGSHTSMFGYFGRVDYSFDDKYLATVTVRRDASSKFGENNRWGTFPSISLGWRISDEAFMNNAQWLDDLKLRAGYGTTGNSNIGSYNWAFQFATGTSYHYAIDGSNNSAYTGYGVSTLGDPNAKWETTRMLNIGFDATAFQKKLTIGFDYYIKKTTDMLVAANWSAQAGSASKPRVNIGDMQNNGVDFNIGWNGKVNKFSYGVSANVSHYKNEVIKLGGSDLIVNLSPRLGNVTKTTEGQPIGMFIGYEVLGIYQDEADVLGYTGGGSTTVLPWGVKTIGDLNPTSFVGRYKFKDVNNDGKIDAGDETVIGDPHPDFTGGFNLNAGYGNWDFSTYLYYSVGNDLLKVFMYYTHFGLLGSSYSKDRRDNSWSAENPDGIYPLWVGAGNEASESSSVANSLAVEDGSYIRMQNIQLGYTLPTSVTSKIDVSKLRFYGQISNVFTITKYSGLDPETRGSSDMRKGLDYGGYGIPRQFILGVNLTF